MARQHPGIENRIRRAVTLTEYSRSTTEELDLAALDESQSLLTLCFFLFFLLLFLPYLGFFIS